MSLSNIKVNNSTVIGVDDEPTPNSNNIVKSDGVYNEFIKSSNIAVAFDLRGEYGFYRNATTVDNSSVWKYKAVDISDYQGKILFMRAGDKRDTVLTEYCFYKLNDDSSVSVRNSVIKSIKTECSLLCLIKIPDNAVEICISYDYSSANKVVPILQYSESYNELLKTNDTIQSMLLGGASDIFTKDSMYIDVNGVEHSTAARFSITDKIYVSVGDSFYLKSVASNILCKIACYSDNGTFLSDLSVFGTGYDDITFNVTSDQISYIKFSCENKSTAEFYYIKCSLLKKINEINTVDSNNADFSLIKNEVLGVITWGTKYPGLNKFIKKLNITDVERIDHILSVYSIGFTQGRFFIWVYDATEERDVYYAITDVYESVPASGVERVVFTQLESRISGEKADFCIECVVDWSQYANVTIPDQDTDSGIILTNLSVDLLSIGTGQNLISDINGATILKGKYVLNSTVYVPDGKTIIGDNCTITCGENAHIILGRGTIIENITFEGGWNLERESYQSGYLPLITEQQLVDNDTDALWGEGKTNANYLIKIGDSSKAQNSSVLNCTFNNFERLVIHLAGGAHHNKENGQVRGCYFNKCWCGIYVTGEFTRVSDNCFWQCVICINLYGGNIAKVGNTMKGNDVGYFYSVGTNGGHGQMVGCEIAHSNVAGVYIKQLAENTGDIITGSQLVDAPLIAEECHGLHISGCRYDTWTKITTGDHNAIVNNLVGTGYTKGHSLYTVPSDTKICFNSPIHNATDAEINPTGHGF